MKMKKITAWILTIVLIGCLGAVAPVQAQEEPDRTEGYDLMLYGMAEEIWVGDRRYMGIKTAAASIHLLRTSF